MQVKDKFAVGVDIGGTTIKLGIVSSKGKIISKNFLKTKSDKGPKAIIKQVKKGIKELIENSNLKIEGIGIGVPGTVKSKKGIVENPPNFVGWKRVNLSSQLKKDLNFKIFLENDANAAAVGELIFGAGKKKKSFVMITLGTGVGGGIILNRKLYRGDFGAAGEIGHITIDFNGPKCNCGSSGCIEAYAGNNYFISNVKKKLAFISNSKILELVKNNLELISPKIVFDAAQLGDEFALNEISDLGSKLGIALASVCNLLDVSSIIIGGGVAGFGNLLFENIECTMKKRVLKSLTSRVKVIPAKLKNEAGIKGAAALVFYKL